jgi:hypothetical protein
MAIALLLNSKKLFLEVLALLLGQTKQDNAALPDEN